MENEQRETPGQPCAADSGGSDAPGRLYTSRQAMHDANTSAEYI